MPTKTHPNISSAEMTAAWRSQYPAISKDKYSHLLVSQLGYDKAQDYCHNEYPHAALQMSIRAGYCFEQCSKLLNEGEYDAVVSLGSGFSLLTLAIADIVAPDETRSELLTLVDCDMDPIMTVRNSRIASTPCVQEKLNQASITFQNEALDLEQVFTSGQLLTDFLPDNVTKPIFVLEGLVYFLSLECQNWLFEQISDGSQFDQSALVMDYWPEDAAQISQLFRDKVLPFFAETTTVESVKELMSETRLSHIIQPSSYFEQHTLSSAEKQLTQNMSEYSPVFSEISENDYIPP